MVILDGSVLDKLASDVGPEVVIELIDLMLSRSADQIREILEASNAQDFKRLTILVHTLKSSAASLGAADLSEICRQIEQKCKANDTAEVPSLVAKLEGEFKAAMTRLEKERSERSAG